MIGTDKSVQNGGRWKQIACREAEAADEGGKLVCFGGGELCPCSSLFGMRCALPCIAIYRRGSSGRNNSNRDCGLAGQLLFSAQTAIAVALVVSGGKVVTFLGIVRTAPFLLLSYQFYIHPYPETIHLSPTRRRPPAVPVQEDKQGRCHPRSGLIDDHHAYGCLVFDVLRQDDG